MALLMISAAWAYVAKMAMWKKVVLFLSAFPLAILGNSLRVISIFVIAEYGDADWARTTWHDWSGLLLFYPFSLMLLLVIHSLLEGGLPWKQAETPDGQPRDRHPTQGNPNNHDTARWLLPVLLGGTMSSIYFLPQVGAVADSAVKMELPGTYGSWIFRQYPPSEAELQALSADTQFSKAICLSARPGETDAEGYSIPDQIQLSIVLSGYDLNNSIHRPERCMPAQGHDITSTKDVVLNLSNKRQFAAKRLRLHREFRRATSPPIPRSSSCITYYFFVGHDQVTNDHLKRTFIDMKDRLVRGMDQRWAYVSVSMWYGKVPSIATEVTEEEADRKLREFIAGFAEKQVKWDQIMQ